MSLFFTALLILSHFNPLLPGYNDFQTKTKADLVRSYSAACLDLFDRQEFKDADVAGVLQIILKDQGTKSELDEDIVTTNKKKSIDKIDVHQAIDLYTKFCRQNPDLTALDGYDTELKAAAEKYTALVSGLPNTGDLRNIKLPQATDITSSDGALIGEIYKNGARRKWVSINDLPPFLPKAFVSLEDHRFFEHPGVDEIGLMRAFFKGYLSDKRPEGGSTITQQVARNLFLDDSLSLERKLREILIAERLEDELTKREILELYLNLVYFGQNCWGIESAAETYFGKKAALLNEFEVAYLAGIVQGPNLYQYKDTRTEARVNLVLRKMFEQKVVPSLLTVDMNKDLKFIQSSEVLQSDYFRDYISERQAADKSSITGTTIKTTLNVKLQRVAQDALRDGLIDYEKQAKKYIWRGPVTNIAKYLNQKKENEKNQTDLAELQKTKNSESFFAVLPDDAKDGLTTNSEIKIPYWLSAIRQVRLHSTIPVESWTVGVILDDNGKVGTPDGTEASLSNRNWAKNLVFGDVVYLKHAVGNQYEVVQVPEVNGAVVAMDPQTGQILSMVGGFSYHLSQFNRATSAQRQPGSLVKPFTYMAALQKGIQPNTILHDESRTFPPSSNGGQPWTPRDYEGTTVPPRTMRWALEQSRNVMTSNLISQVGLDSVNQVGLDSVRKLTQEFGLYENPSTNYPSILGTQETNLLALVRAFSAIDNGGYLFTPEYVNSKTPDSKKIQGVDDITLFQMRSLLQGVVARGTAISLSDLSPFVAGKTGTTEDLKDAWFIEFTPYLVVGVFVGYDQPATLGKGFSGAAVALPIAAKILRASFDFYHAKEDFPPPPEGVVSFPTDQTNGEPKAAGTPGAVLEYYRKSVVNVQQKAQ